MDSFNSTPPPFCQWLTGCGQVTAWTPQTSQVGMIVFHSLYPYFLLLPIFTLLILAYFRSKVFNIMFVVFTGFALWPLLCAVKQFVTLYLQHAEALWGLPFSWMTPHFQTRGSARWPRRSQTYPVLRWWCCHDWRDGWYLQSGQCLL